jgi:GNAT superfamily N-acetyltransferase
MTTTPLAQDEVERAAGVIARAFQDDPLMVYMHPDAGDRARLGPPHFAAVVRLGVGHGRAWRTPGFEAVSTWLAPGGWPPPGEALGAAGFGGLADAVGAEALERFLGVYGWIDTMHLDEPHWLLQLIGVEPEARGTGLGRSVLEPGLALADEAGEPCYLETLLERNVGFYEANGFETVISEVHPESGLRFWGMRRPPGI